jgi:hypothetical protein
VAMNLSPEIRLPPSNAGPVKRLQAAGWCLPTR